MSTKFSAKSQTKCFLKKDNFLWEVPISDYSFAQEITEEAVHSNRMPSGAQGSLTLDIEGVERMQKEAAEWTLVTPLMPFKSSGSGTGKVDDVANNHHSVDEPLWSSLLAGGPSYKDADSSLTLTQSTWTGANITNGVNSWTFHSSGDKTMAIANLYILGRGMATDALDASDAEAYTFSVAIGGTAIPRAYQPYTGTSYAEMRAHANKYHNGLCYFVTSILGGYNEEQAPRIVTNLYLCVPQTTDSITTDRVAAYLTANGNLTVSASTNGTGIWTNANSDDSRTSYYNPTAFKHTQDSYAAQLGAFDLYFLTNVSNITTGALAGTSGANNTFLGQHFGKQDGLSEHISKDGVINSTFRGQGRISHRGCAVDNLFHNSPGAGTNVLGAGFANGWCSGWEFHTFPTSGGKKSWDHAVLVKDASGKHVPTDVVFPTQVVRGSSTFTVNQTNKTWSDGTYTHNIPAFKFCIEGSTIVRDSIQVLEAHAFPNNGASLGYSKSNNQYNTTASTGFIRGDQFVFPATTTSTNASAHTAVGTQLGAELRLVVTSCGIGDINNLTSYLEDIVYYLGNNNTDRYESIYNSNQPSFIDEDFYLTFTDQSTGTTHDLTRAANRSTIFKSTTAAIQTAGTDRKDYTLEASNSDIIPGSIVLCNELPDNHLLFVSTISGTSVVFNNAVTLSADATLEILSYDANHGLSNGEYMAYHDPFVGTNYFIVRHPVANNSITTKDIIKIHSSKTSTKDGARVVKVKNCVTDTAVISSSLGETCSTSWSGFANEVLTDADDFYTGSSAPSSPYAGQIHYDTDNAQVKIRNAANSAWVDCFTEGVNNTDTFMYGNNTTLELQSLTVAGKNTQGEIISDFRIKDYIFYGFKVADDQGTKAYDTVADGYSGLSSVSGFSSNVASYFLNNGAGAAELEHFAYDEVSDLTLEINGTEYAGSTHCKGIQVNSSGPVASTDTVVGNIRASTTFGDFVVLVDASNTITRTFKTGREGYETTHTRTERLPVVRVLFSTGSDANYNTATKLDGHHIKLKAKSSSYVYPEYNIPVTSFSMEIKNNLEMIIPNVLGPSLNKPLGHVRNQRDINLSFNAFLDDNISGLIGNIEYKGEVARSLEEESTRGTRYHGLVKLGKSSDSSMLEMSIDNIYLNLPSVTVENPFTAEIFGTVSSLPSLQFIGK